MESLVKQSAPPTDARTILEAAVRKYGSQGRFARAVGVSQQAISKAIHSNYCSLELALILHRKTNGELDRTILCPKLAMLL